MQIIDYKAALKQRNRRSILESLARAGGEIRLTELIRSMGIPKNTIEHHLTVLKRNKLISDERDMIRLEYKTPLCYIFDSPKTPYAYLGLLGERKGKE